MLLWISLLSLTVAQVPVVYRRSSGPQSVDIPKAACPSEQGCRIDSVDSRCVSKKFKDKVVTVTFTCGELSGLGEILVGTQRIKVVEPPTVQERRNRLIFALDPLFQIEGSNLPPAPKLIFEPSLEAGTDYELLREQSSSTSLSLKLKTRWRNTPGPLRLVRLESFEKTMIDVDAVVANVQAEVSAHVGVMVQANAAKIYQSSPLMILGAGFSSDFTRFYFANDDLVLGPDYSITTMSKSWMTLTLDPHRRWAATAPKFPAQLTILAVAVDKNAPTPVGVDETKRGVVVAEVFQDPVVPQPSKPVIIYESLTKEFWITGDFMIPDATAVFFGFGPDKPPFFTSQVMNSTHLKVSLKDKWPLLSPPKKSSGFFSSPNDKAPNSYEFELKLKALDPPRNIEGVPGNLESVGGLGPYTFATPPIVARVRKDADLVKVTKTPSQLVYRSAVDPSLKVTGKGIGGPGGTTPSYAKKKAGGGKNSCQPPKLHVIAQGSSSSSSLRRRLQETSFDVAVTKYDDGTASFTGSPFAGLDDGIVRVEAVDLCGETFGQEDGVIATIVPDPKIVTSSPAVIYDKIPQGEESLKKKFMVKIQLPDAQLEKEEKADKSAVLLAISPEKYSVTAAEQQHGDPGIVQVALTLTPPTNGFFTEEVDLEGDKVYVSAVETTAGRVEYDPPVHVATILPYDAAPLCDGGDGPCRTAQPTRQPTPIPVIPEEEHHKKKKKKKHHYVETTTTTTTMEVPDTNATNFFQSTFAFAAGAVGLKAPNNAVLIGLNAGLFVAFILIVLAVRCVRIERKRKADKALDDVKGDAAWRPPASWDDKNVRRKTRKPVLKDSAVPSAEV